ncbi:hypothetical protein [Tabrizicola aquatica]|uniref:hypothetical protein n=1 Tax=Tabrizicola aquatica TaxID=909926 RepID=UPI0011AFBE25|nr:hypothetical protein [Tabrizicola aquatica]
MATGTTAKSAAGEKIAVRQSLADRAADPASAPVPTARAKQQGGLAVQPTRPVGLRQKKLRHCAWSGLAQFLKTQALPLPYRPVSRAASPHLCRTLHADVAGIHVRDITNLIPHEPMDDK